MPIMWNPEQKKDKFEELKKDINYLLEENINLDTLMKKIVILLKEKIDYYNWVGFYLIDPDKKDELILGPFEGDPTEHVRIPFGRGICGQAAETKLIFVVQDVSKENNYLSCSPNVKSEIVLPILDEQGNVLGELDIDSHELEPFSNQDKEFLEWICHQLSPLFKNKYNNVES